MAHGQGDGIIKNVRFDRPNEPDLADTRFDAHGRRQEIATGQDAVVAGAPTSHKHIYQMSPEELLVYVAEKKEALRRHSLGAGYTGDEYTRVIAPANPNDLADRTISKQLT